MFRLHCPHCAAVRDEEEFSYAGEAFIVRPANPEAVDDAVWGDYLFHRTNPKGWLWEQWQHSGGCRKVFAVKRHTGTYLIAGSWTLKEAKTIYLADQDTLGQSQGQIAGHLAAKLSSTGRPNQGASA